MRVLFWTLFLITTLILGVGIATYEPYSPVSYAEPPTSYLYTPQVLVTILNRERATIGSKRLVLDERLNQSAKIKLDDMVKNDYYSHVNPSTGIRGYSYIPQICHDVGENLTGAKNNPIAMWDTSPEHKKAQLDNKYDIVGFAGGIDKRGNFLYVTHFCQLR